MVMNLSIELATALISAAVSLVSVLVAIYISRKTISSQKENVLLQSRLLQRQETATNIRVYLATLQEIRIILLLIDSKLNRSSAGIYSNKLKEITPRFYSSWSTARAQFGAEAESSRLICLFRHWAANLHTALIDQLDLFVKTKSDDPDFNKEFEKCVFYAENMLKQINKLHSDLNLLATGLEES